MTQTTRSPAAQRAEHPPPLGSAPPPSAAPSTTGRPALSRRGLLSLAAASALAGCGPRIAFTTAERPSRARTRTVLLATNRSTSRESGIGFGRTQALSFSAIDVAMPEGRRAGASPFAARGDGFAVAGTRPVGSQAALRDVLTARPQDDLVLWVHGFNTTPAGAVYRQAQMAEDFGMEGPQVAFAWPSAERNLTYLHDRDPVLHACAPLERLVR